MGASDEEGAAAGEDTAGALGSELKYTDADVDRIVQKRLAKEREKYRKTQSEEDRASEADKRLAELDARERRLAQAEAWYKADDGLPDSALEFLDYSSDEALEASRTKLQTLVRDLELRQERRRARGTTPKTGNRGHADNTRAVFGL